MTKSKWGKILGDLRKKGVIKEDTEQLLYERVCKTMEFELEKEEKIITNLLLLIDPKEIKKSLEL